ncbi:MAG TPA: XRE family transcriptional regulator [Sulfurimonas sp.]|nr:XRE family transcriptional regulator [Sulfurimonas sp.]
MQLYEIGKKIKELRKEKGLTQEALAELAGISRVTLGKLERGDTISITMNTLYILLDCLSYEFIIQAKESNSFGLTSLDQI